MVSVQAISTALPAHRYDAKSLLEESSGWLATHPEQREKFERFVRSARTESRFFTQPVSEILKIKGLEDRAALFERHGTTLGELSLRAALERARILPGDLGTVVFTSCTCPVIPSIDTILVERVGLDPNINRVPIYQYGCAGGVAGLALAAKLAEVAGPVALISVELCSLVFHRDDHSAGHLVGSAIFADGSATAIVSKEDSPLAFVASRSHLLPATRHLMGYDLHDDGSHLRLARELPEMLAAQVPKIVSTFLTDHSLHSSVIDWWLFHPGGIKILDSLERLFCSDPSVARWSRQVLREVGNLSSATVLFVLDAFLTEAPYESGDHVLLLGIGPGLTVELILFKVR